MKLLAESFTIYLADHPPCKRETCHWLILIQITDLHGIPEISLFEQTTA